MRHNARKYIFYLLLIIGSISFCTIVVERAETSKKVLSRLLTHLLCEQMQCQGEMEVQKFTLLNPKVYIKSLNLHPKANKEWSITAHNMVLSFSWTSFFLRRAVFANVDIENLVIQSQFERNRLAVAPHLLALLRRSNFFIPFDIKSLSVTQGSMGINTATDRLHSQFKWTNTIAKSGNKVDMHGQLYSGILLKHGKQKASIFNASSHGTATINKDGRLTFNARGTLPGILNKNNLITLTGELWNDKLQVSIKDSQGLVDINSSSTGVSKVAFNLNGKVSPKIIETALPFSLPFGISGDGDLSFHGTIEKDLVYCGTYTTSNCLCSSLKLLDYLSCEFMSSPKESLGSIVSVRHGKPFLQGAWEWSQGKPSGTYSLSTIESTRNSDSKVTLNGTFNGREITGSYKVGQCPHPTGVFSLGANALIFKGPLFSYLFDVDVNLRPFTIRCLNINDQVNKRLIAFDTNNEYINGMISYELFQQLMPPFIRPIFSGQGIVRCSGKLKNNVATGILKLDEGSIFLGHTSNFITQSQMQVEFDFNKHRVTIPTGTFTLHKGTATITDAQLTYDHQTLTPKTYSLPLTAHEIFLGWHNIAALISGNLELSYPYKDNPLLSGSVSLDNGLFNNNILSGHLKKEISRIFHQTITPSDLICGIDLFVKTKKDINIKTELLSTHASVDLHVFEDSQNPKISGSIHLHGGNIAFPYKKLFIKQGNIHFLPEQPYNPLLEIVAKNVVKNYKVSMYVTGSTQDPTIHLESNPSLTEEQIGALLLSGSEDTSINLLMPALIAQNMKTLLTGNKKTQSLARKRFSQALLKPLRHIRLIPIFTDQTGRDGFKTALEINASDRLHARIEKNFSITEDTSFEIDYALSDDVHAKIIKNELGDLGGEIEMRWKF